MQTGLHLGRPYWTALHWEVVRRTWHYSPSSKSTQRQEADSMSFDNLDSLYLPGSGELALSKAVQIIPDLPQGLMVN